MREKLKAREISYIALGTALICACAWLSIPFAVPVTMQSFAVCLLAALLGLRLGLWSVGLYIFLGAAGLPVFSLFRGGIGLLLGAGGGFIFGFVLMAAAVGAISGKHGRSMPVLLVSMGLGTLLCYAAGSLWYALVYTQDEQSIKAILGLCVLPYLLPDAVKIFLAAVLTKRLYPVIWGKEQPGEGKLNMKEKEKPVLQLEAQKNPGPYVSYTYLVHWLENGVITRLPHESVRNFDAANGFEAAGKRYSSFAQLKAEKESDSGYRDIYGRQVFEVKERFPCFDSYDYLNEDRYYRWLYIQENGRLCCICYADSRREMSVTEDAEKVNERSYRAMKESGYCDCI